MDGRESLRLGIGRSDFPNRWRLAVLIAPHIVTALASVPTEERVDLITQQLLHPSPIGRRGLTKDVDEVLQRTHVVSGRTIWSMLDEQH
jgi:hypothetical protein